MAKPRTVPVQLTKRQVYLLESLLTTVLENKGAVFRGPADGDFAKVLDDTRCEVRRGMLAHMNLERASRPKSSQRAPRRKAS